MEQKTCPLVVFGGKVGFLVLWNWMFSVFINEKKKQIKVPKAYGCSITHTPPTRRAPGKEQKTRGAKSGARPGRGGLPVQSAEPEGRGSFLPGKEWQVAWGGRGVNKEL